MGAMLEPQARVVHEGLQRKDSVEESKDCRVCGEAQHSTMGKTGCGWPRESEYALSPVVARCRKEEHTPGLHLHMRTWRQCRGHPAAAWGDLKHGEVSARDSLGVRQRLGCQKGATPGLIDGRTGYQPGEVAGQRLHGLVDEKKEAEGSPKMGRLADLVVRRGMVGEGRHMAG